MNKKTAIRPFRYVTSFFVAMFVSTSITWAVEETDTLTPFAFANRDDGITAATTVDPILLHKGIVLEKTVDIAFDTPLGRWEHLRTYQSAYDSKEEESDATDVHGQQWIGGSGARILTPSGENIRLTRTAANSRVFLFRDGGYTPPAGMNATLVKQGTGKNEEFVLTFNESGSVYIYHAFDKEIDELLRGKLKEKTNRNFVETKRSGERYSYDTDGLVASVLTAEPQSYLIRYSYKQIDPATKRLAKIEVFAGNEKAHKFAEAEYLYFEDVDQAHDDIGTLGDLVLVKTGNLLSDKKSWNRKTMQYRYHRSSKGEGFGHQVKSVFEADAVERILQGNSEIKTPEDILKLSDLGELSSKHAAAAYASRHFTYNVDEIDTNKEIETPWGKESLAKKYGMGDYNIPTMPGRVKTETVHASCASCGGSGSKGGVTKTYHYMNAAEIPPPRFRGHSNVVVHVVVEDLQDSDGVPRKRTIYGLHNRGEQLRKIEIENPILPKLNTLATSTITNSNGDPLEVRPASVHSLVDSNELIGKFLKPYHHETQSWENDRQTAHADKGVVRVYQYDNSKPPKRTGELKKIGLVGEAYYVSATDYNDNDDIIAEYDYQTASTSRDAKDRIATRYEYTYWDRNKKVIKTKKTIKATRSSFITQKAHLCFTFSGFAHRIPIEEGGYFHAKASVRNRT